MNKRLNEIGYPIIIVIEGEIMETRKFAETITKLRKEKGLTQKQSAEVFGVSDKAVSKWERSEAMPDVSLLPAIADFYGISIDELLQGEIKEKREENNSFSQNGTEKNRRKKRIILNVSADVFLLLTFIAWLIVGFFTDNGWKEVAFCGAIVLYLIAVIVLRLSDKENLNVKKYACFTLCRLAVAFALFIGCGGVFDSADEYLAAGFTAAYILILYVLNIYREHKSVKFVSKYKIHALRPSIATAALCVFAPFAVLKGESVAFEIRLTVLKALSECLDIWWTAIFFIAFIVAVAYSAVAVCKDLPDYSIVVIWTIVGIFAHILTKTAADRAVEIMYQNYSVGIAKTVAGSYLLYGNILISATIVALHYIEKRKNKCFA